MRQLNIEIFPIFHLFCLTFYLKLNSLPWSHSPERPIKVFRNGTLRILQTTELDGGNYLCAVQRPNGEDVELFHVCAEETNNFYQLYYMKS